MGFPNEIALQLLPRIFQVTRLTHYTFADIARMMRHEQLLRILSLAGRLFVQ